MTSCDELLEWLAGQVGANEVPSVAFGVAQNGKILASGAIGYADVEAKRLATTDTPYALASVSKPLTATALLKLVQDGKIDLDAPINRYLGDASISGRAADPELATVRKVGGHMAGLPLHFQFYYADEGRPRPPFEHTTQKFAKTFWPPGERFVYSNLGFGLLDRVIENVTGAPYKRAMEEMVFGPFGMSLASTDGSKGGEVLSYGPDGVAYPRYQFSHPGGSAIYASVNDLLAFGQRFLNDPINREAFTDVAKMGSRHAYGFGWNHDQTPEGLELWQHEGGMGGVRTRFTLVPALDLVVVALCNGESGVARETVDRILKGFATETGSPSDEKPNPVSLQELKGCWGGLVECDEGPIELRLNIDAEDHVSFGLGKARGVVESANFTRGALFGEFSGEIPDSEASLRPHKIYFELALRESRLQGAVTTISTTPNGSGGAPEKRIGDGLSFWTDLKRL